MGFRKWMGSRSVPERQAGKSEGTHCHTAVWVAARCVRSQETRGGGLWGLKQVPTPLSPAPLSALSS